MKKTRVDKLGRIVLPINYRKKNKRSDGRSKLKRKNKSKNKKGDVKHRLFALNKNEKIYAGPLIFINPR